MIHTPHLTSIKATHTLQHTHITLYPLHHACLHTTHLCFTHIYTGHLHRTYRIHSTSDSHRVHTPYTISITHPHCTRTTCKHTHTTCKHTHYSTHMSNCTFSHHVYPHRTTFTHTPLLDIPITPEHTDTTLQSRHTYINT